MRANPFHELPSIGPVIGVDLGGTNMNAGLLRDDGQVVARISDKTRAGEGRDAVIHRLIGCIERCCAEAGLGLEQIATVGVVAPGAVDIPAGVILDAPNLRWENTPLRDLLQQRIHRPVIVDNDVNGAVWGEFCAGAARNASDCLGVWVGTGVGGGLVIDGRLHHGARYTAGEIGQTILYPDRPADDRTLEHHASRTGMSRLIHRWKRDHPDTMLKAMGALDDDIVPSRQLAQAVELGDPLAQRMMEHAAHTLGIAIANVMTVLALEQIVIGGGVTEALGEPFLERVRTHYRECVFPERNRSVPLVRTQLEAEAGLIGAALLAADALTP